MQWVLRISSICAGGSFASLFVVLLLLHWFLDCEDSRFALPCLLACELRSYGCSISRSSLLLRPPSSAAPRSSACSPPFFLQVSLLLSSSCSWRLFVAWAVAPMGGRGRNVWKRRPGPSAVYLSLESGPRILCYGGSVWCSRLVCCNESAIKDWCPAYCLELQSAILCWKSPVFWDLLGRFLELV